MKGVVRAAGSSSRRAWINWESSDETAEMVEGVSLAFPRIGTQMALNYTRQCWLKGKKDEGPTRWNCGWPSLLIVVAGRKVTSFVDGHDVKAHELTVAKSGTGSDSVAPRALVSAKFVLILLGPK